MRAGLVAALLALAGCSGVADISESRRPLAPDEAAVVHKKADEALAAREWKAAWEQEAEAGADRGRLETIFLASLAADAGPYEDMHKKLVAKFGGLTPESMARAQRLANEAEGQGDWKRAADVLILVSEDAPRYRMAWELYARVPTKVAPDVLHRIQDARRDWEEAKKAEDRVKAGAPPPPAATPPAPETPESRPGGENK
jgi:hypothetical protein